MKDDLRDVLAAEAAATRPEFSEPLHARVMAALPGVSCATPRLRTDRGIAVAAALAMACGIAAFLAVRPVPQPPPPAAPQPVGPLITLQITTPPLPDMRREAPWVVRQVTVAVRRLLARGPLPITFTLPGEAPAEDEEAG